jgi:hypothetical protein
MHDRITVEQGNILLLRDGAETVQIRVAGNMVSKRGLYCRFISTMSASVAFTACTPSLRGNLA